MTARRRGSLRKPVRLGISSTFHELSTFNFQPSTFNLQLSTFNFQLSTFNFQLSTFNLVLVPSRLR